MKHIITLFHMASLTVASSIGASTQPSNLSDCYCAPPCDVPPRPTDVCWGTSNCGPGTTITCCDPTTGYGCFVYSLPSDCACTVQKCQAWCDGGEGSLNKGEPSCYTACQKAYGK